VYEDDLSRKEATPAEQAAAEPKKEKSPEERQAEIIPKFSAAVQVFLSQNGMGRVLCVFVCHCY
jgi:hypothetical protein